MGNKESAVDEVVDYIDALFGSGRKGVRGKAIYYLVKRTDDYVTLQEIANFVGCSPQSVMEALEPCVKNEVTGKYVEERRLGAESGVRGSHLYKLRKSEFADTLRRLFEIGEKL